MFPVTVQDLMAIADAGGDHAAEIDLVRTETSRWIVDARHLSGGLVKVLVADKFEQSGLDGLKAAGCEVISQPDLKDDSLAAAIRDTGADVLIVRSTKVTEAMLDAGRLSLIVRAVRATTPSTSPPPRAAVSTSRIVRARTRSRSPSSRSR